MIDETVWLPTTPVAVLANHTFFGTGGKATPVAVLTGSAGATVSSISADWLNAPHIVANSSKVNQWTWDHAAFGDNPPNNNPNGLGAFNYSLGFPGQFYDSQTALYHNGFRDYNPLTGRYVESDPLASAAGRRAFIRMLGGIRSRMLILLV